MVSKAFISYAHIDERALDRLHKHLTLLQREGKINTWSDHKILPGDKLNGKINESLESSTIFLALVSPDYLASNYCYDKEFKYAMSLSEANKIRIIPVILEPCDWLASPLSQFMALPKDGKPISEWTNQNNAFLDVVTGLRRMLEEADNNAASTAFSRDSTREIIGKRPRIKQDFDSIQKSDFADKTYLAVRSYFESSCKELNDAGDGIIKSKFEPMGPTVFTCTVVNRSRRSAGEAHITVRNSKRRGHFGDINYVYQAHAEDGTSNGSIRIEADDYNLYLKMDNLSHYGRDEPKYSPEQAAEKLWVDFVKNAGVDYE